MPGIHKVVMAQKNQITMGYKVPFDIINAILNDLSYNCDWESIRSLSRTCKILVEPCQKHLFNTIAIHQTTITQLNSVLANHPNLVSYILHLHYYMDGESDVCAHILLLQKFSRLWSLHITGDGTDKGTIWNVMPGSLQEQLIWLLRFPELEFLSLTCICSWPVSLFANCGNLHQLQVGALGLDATNLTTFVSLPFPPPCQPKTLSINASAFYFLMIFSPWNGQMGILSSTYL